MRERHTDMDETSGVLVLTASEIARLLQGRDAEVLEAVKTAYEAHARGATSLPHSSFLRFSNRPTDRIIALPAYLGDPFDLAGIKWVASFPGNVVRGLDR